MSLTEKILAELHATIVPGNYLDYRHYLGDVYQHLKKKFEDYSYRRFAKDLGYKAGTVMHQVVRGHRPLTAKAARGLVEELRLKGAERRYFLALVDYCNARKPGDRDKAFAKLLLLKERSLPAAVERDVLEYFSEWYHPVIRELIASPDFEKRPENRPEWIASKVKPRIRPEQVRASLELLQRLNLIEVDAETGALKQSRERVATGHRVQSMAISGFHRAMIDLGREAIDRVEGPRRDIAAVTVCVSEATAEKLKAMLRAFQMQLLDEASAAGPGEQVYQINMQFFPFTE